MNSLGSASEPMSELDGFTVIFWILLSLVGLAVCLWVLLFLFAD